MKKYEKLQECLNVRIDFWDWMWAEKINLLRSIFDKFVFIHVLVGSVFCYRVHDYVDFSKTILVPFASIIFGISFAWGGNAVALLSDRHVMKVASCHAKGFEYYVYKFLFSMFVLISVLLLWIFVASDIFSANLSIYGRSLFFISLFMSSVAVREVWSIVIGVQYFLIWKYYKGNSE
jgi:hypothetical protein